MNLITKTTEAKQSLILTEVTTIVYSHNQQFQSFQNRNYYFLHLFHLFIYSFYFNLVYYLKQTDKLGEKVLITFELRNKNMTKMKAV